MVISWMPRRLLRRKFPRLSTLACSSCFTPFRLSIIDENVSVELRVEASRTGTCVSITFLRALKWSSMVRVSCCFGEDLGSEILSSEAHNLHSIQILWRKTWSSLLLLFLPLSAPPPPSPDRKLVKTLHEFWYISNDRDLTWFQPFFVEQQLLRNFS